MTSPIPTRPPIYIDTPAGPRLVEQKSGARLNFLYDALMQARVAGVGADEATDALIKEVSDYYGVVLRKKAREKAWHLPGDGVADPESRLNQLLPPETRHEIATKIFLALDTFKGKSQFHTWVYTITDHEIADAITKQMQLRASRFSAVLPEGVIDNPPRGKKTVNVEEIKTERRLDRKHDVKMSEDRWKAESYAFDFRLRQQSTIDQRFIKLVMDAEKGSYGTIAKELRWPLKKVYNRIAKFKKLELLPVLPVNLKKREQNRRARAKLAMSRVPPSK
jgi:DNA-directed RNA polymerase specialized sigma24 family protein